MTPPVRELRTSNADPQAPRLELLFGRERPAPARTLLIWDPAGNWPALSMASLAGPAEGSGSVLHEVRLRREGQVDPLLSVQHLRLDTADGELGVMHLTAPPVDATSVRLALALLEQADAAVILAGSAFDVDLQRRVRAQRDGAPWHGPTVVLAAPADRPIRAQRLRRLEWAPELRTEVIELSRVAHPRWSHQFVEQIRRHVQATGPTTPTVTVLAPAELPRPRIDAALDVIQAAAGVCGVAWLCPAAPARSVCRGRAADTPETITAAESVWACAAAQAGDGVLEGLDWQTADHHVALLPVGAPFGGLLLAIADRRSGDAAQVRWQLAVARNALA